jgi:hypothetical protein
MVKDTIQQLTEELSCSFTGFDKSRPPAGVSVVVRLTNQDMDVHFYHVICWRKEETCWIGVN